MAQPTWLAGGNTPHVSDSRWFILVRWLAKLRNNGLGTAAEDPKRTDTRWTLLLKINRCLH
jgi:hypothetical protein